MTDQETRHSSEVFVERHPVIVKFEDELWRKLDAAGGEAIGLDALEYAAVCVMNFQVEVYNGGLHQYLSNSSGQYAADTPEVFIKIGAPRVAAILEEANRLLGDDGPPKDFMERNARLDAMDEAAEDRLDALTDQFHEIEDDGERVGDLFDSYVIAKQS
ncbi:MAG: DUF4375 domain-containing protein [Planctomycetota bacterium]